MNGLGNQPAKVTDANLGWLAGMIDGEGSIGLEQRQPTRSNRYGQILPKVRISNTHGLTLTYMTDLLSEMHVGHYVRWNERGKGGFTSRKPLWTIVIQGMKRVQTLLDQVLPHLVIKRRQGEAVGDYIHSRMAGLKKAHYLPLELDLARKVKELNRESHH